MARSGLLSRPLAVVTPALRSARLVHRPQATDRQAGLKLAQYVALGRQPTGREPVHSALTLQALILFQIAAANYSPSRLATDWRRTKGSRQLRNTLQMRKRPPSRSTDP